MTAEEKKLFLIKLKEWPNIKIFIMISYIVVFLKNILTNIQYIHHIQYTY